MYTFAIYCTVKNFGSEQTLTNLVNYSNSPSFLANFHNFHSITYGFTIAFYPSMLGIFLKRFVIILTCQLTHTVNREIFMYENIHVLNICVNKFSRVPHESILT